jgi:hypothetical protein
MFENKITEPELALIGRLFLGSGWQRIVLIFKPDPKNNRPIKSHVRIRPRTDMSHVNMMEGSPADCKFCEALL